MNRHISNQLTEKILTYLQEYSLEEVADMVPVSKSVIYKTMLFYLGKRKNPKRMLSQEQVDQIKEMLKTKSIYQIWKETGYNKGTLYCIKTGKSYG